MSSRIILAGYPNVGKSVVFNRLTGMDVISSNYPGTTIEIARGFLKWEGERYEMIDLPGFYSLEPTCKAEEIAVKLISRGDLIVQVVNATNLERNLNLTLQLIQQRKPMLIALNMFDETKQKGIDIDVAKLEQILDLPVVPTSALTGEGIKELVTTDSTGHDLKIKSFREGEVPGIQWYMGTIMIGINQLPVFIDHLLEIIPGIPFQCRVP
jgi:ferrous iron transport protein B